VTVRTTAFDKGKIGSGTAEAESVEPIPGNCTSLTPTTSFLSKRKRVLRSGNHADEGFALDFDL
jgi:hypothetical protein